MKKGEQKRLKNSSKKDRLFLIDTMVLINFTERCESRDLFDLFKKVGIHFKIVEEVEKEFKEGIKPIGKSRFNKHLKDGIIQVISNDDIKIDEEKMEYLINKGFGKGELFSSLFFITQEDIKFVSDEKRVHDVFKQKLKICVSRTSDLLDILVAHKIIDKNQKKDILEELIKKGFWLKNMGV